MPKPYKRKMSWSVRRQGGKWLAKLTVGDKAMTIGTAKTKAEARLIARRVAAEYSHP